MKCELCNNEIKDKKDFTAGFLPIGSQGIFNLLFFQGLFWRVIMPLLQGKLKEKIHVYHYSCYKKLSYSEKIKHNIIPVAGKGRWFSFNNINFVLKPLIVLIVFTITMLFIAANSITYFFIGIIVLMLAIFIVFQIFIIFKVRRIVNSILKLN